VRFLEEKMREKDSLIDKLNIKNAGMAWRSAVALFRVPFAFR
jgi:hypothetical protein